MEYARFVGDIYIYDVLDVYPKFRGFKGNCIKKFIRFIEFENLENYCEGNFYEFKKKYKK